MEERTKDSTIEHRHAHFTREGKQILGGWHRAEIPHTDSRKHDPAFNDGNTSNVVTIRRGKKNKAKWETASYFYSLYSMERVGVMAKLRNVGKHFWYIEGAEGFQS